MRCCRQSPLLRSLINLGTSMLHGSASTGGTCEQSRLSCSSCSQAVYAYPTRGEPSNEVSLRLEWLSGDGPHGFCWDWWYCASLCSYGPRHTITTMSRRPYSHRSTRNQAWLAPTWCASIASPVVPKYFIPSTVGRGWGPASHKRIPCR